MQRTKLQQLVRNIVNNKSIAIESIDSQYDLIANQFDTAVGVCEGLESDVTFLKNASQISESEYKARMTSVSNNLRKLDIAFTTPSFESVTTLRGQMYIATESLAETIKTAWYKALAYLKELFRKFLAMFSNDQQDVSKTINRLQDIKPKISPEICTIKVEPVTADELHVAAQTEEVTPPTTKSPALALSAPRNKGAGDVLDVKAIQSSKAWLGLAFSKFGAIPANDHSITLSKNVPKDLHDQIDQLTKTANLSMLRELQADIVNIAKKHPDVDNEGAFDYYGRPLDEFATLVWRSLISNWAIEDNIDDDADVYNVELIGNRRIRALQNRKHYASRQGQQFTMEPFILVNQAKREEVETKPVSLRDLGIHSQGDFDKISESLDALEKLEKQIAEFAQEAQLNILDLEDYNQKTTVTAKVHIKMWKTVARWLTFVRAMSLASISVGHSVNELAAAAIKADSK